MAAVLTPTTRRSDLFARIGDVPRERIILNPAPGMATYADAIRFCERKDGVACEWIDGVLVEKAMGARDSLIGSELHGLLWLFVRTHRLGRTAGEQYMFRVDERQIRMPDISVLSQSALSRLTEPIPAAVSIPPDLVVEVLSPGNTRSEMDHKRAEYFTAGVRLYWEVDPATRTITVWTDAETSHTLTDADMLDGGDVLPGFTAVIADLFAVGSGN